MPKASLQFSPQTLSETEPKKTDFPRFGDALKMAPFLSVCLCLFTIVSDVHAQASQDDAVARYYVETAREVFHKQDITRAGGPFAVSAIVRRFTLNSSADTLRLDTAIIRAYYSYYENDPPDTLKPDSQVILRSSFLGNKPTMTVFFGKPVWDGDFVYSLFPNDPGSGDISIAFDSLADDGGLSRWGSSGFLTLDRSSGELKYVALLIRYPDGVSRYSRETNYTSISGYLTPFYVVEHISKVSFWGNQYEIRETRLLKVVFLDTD